MNTYLLPRSQLHLSAGTSNPYRLIDQVTGETVMNSKIISLIAGLCISTSIAAHHQPLWTAAADAAIDFNPGPVFVLTGSATESSTSFGRDGWQSPCNCKPGKPRKAPCPALPCPIA